MSNFIDNLVVVMRNKRLNRSDLAKKIGMYPQQLGYYLNGKGKPSFSTKKRICDAINIPYVIMENGTVEKKANIEDISNQYAPVQKRLAKNLAYYMKDECVSIEKLHKRTGISRATISAYLREEIAMPSLYNIRKVASALGISVGKLLN